MEDTYCEQCDEMVSVVNCKDESHNHVELFICDCGCKEHYDKEEYFVHRWAIEECDESIEEK